MVQVYGWPAFLPAPMQPAAVPGAVLDAYAGRYQRGPDEVVTFRREQGRLVETINAGTGILTYPMGGDTVAFTDYAPRGVFERRANGTVTGFRMLGANQPMPRLRPDELLPNEFVRQGRVAEAMAGYRRLKLNDYQLIYTVYELLNCRPANLPAAEGLLSLAQE